jgi:hypothetical protein
MTEQPDRKRDLLVGELREAVGDDAVERTDLDLDRALERRTGGIGAAMTSSRMLLLIAGAMLLLVGLIASLALDNWLLLVAAMVLHGAFAAVVIASAFMLTNAKEKPAPTVEAALQDEGVADPEAALDDLVKQVGDQRERDGG